MVDRNLFAHDLAIAAILKNEGHYIKEWLDYHLLAGVDHFYLYDNDSTDNYAEIIAPYVDAGLVTSKHIGGKSAQFAAYDDAVLNHRFDCRYMAFVDLDEFILPRTTTDTISATLDDVLKNFPDASGLAVNWQLYGSSGHETADYSRGVLERFTRRAPVDWIVPIPHRDIPGGNAQVKTVANPRRIFCFTSAHFPIYFAGNFSVNERGGRVDSYCNAPVTAERLVVNHYNVKSRAEFLGKLGKGRADKSTNYFSDEWFGIYDRNEIFDDGILKYRAARAEKFALETDEHRLHRMKTTLIATLAAYAENDFPADKLETALTCCAAAERLQEKIFAEASLAAVLKSLDGLNFSDAQLFLSELPNLLRLPYSAADDLRGAAIEIISRLIDFMRANECWKDFAKLEHLRRLLKIF
ncbi:MAG: glycosyltransferase family 92 protein [Quinella sp. 1Q7]|nr:glycosyltransferase family 92 protein [Quinella sp. 1Q7]